MHGTLNVSYICVTNGIDPPSRMNTARLPKPFSSASCATSKNGCVYGATQGLPVLSTSNLQVTVFGSSLRMCRSTSRAIFVRHPDSAPGAWKISRGPSRGSPSWRLRAV